MVGNVPVPYALRDLFYAAGLGFLLCVAYSGARLLPGPVRAVRFLCDASLGLIGAFLYRSACVSRFYAGQPRWYTFAGCALCFFACRASLAPLMERAGAFLRRRLAWPFAALWRRVLRPLSAAVSARFFATRAALRARREKQKRAAQKKRLQTGGHVLYNSK